MLDTIGSADLIEAVDPGIERSSDRDWRGHSRLDAIIGQQYAAVRYSAIRASRKQTAVGDRLRMQWNVQFRRSIDRDQT